MILASAAALLTLVLGGAATAAPPGQTEYAQVTVQERVIVRMRRPGVQTPQAAPVVHWRETRGPRCIPVRAVAGATGFARNSVDLVLRDNRRIRVQLDRSCPGIDFYGGFYVNGTQDGMICADREAIRSRMGGECQIDQFRTLTAVRP